MGEVSSTGSTVTLKTVNKSTSFDVRNVKYDSEDRIESADLFITYVASKQSCTQEYKPTSATFDLMKAAIQLVNDSGAETPAEWTSLDHTAVKDAYGDWVAAELAEWEAMGGIDNIYAGVDKSYAEFQLEEEYPAPAPPFDPVCTVISSETNTCTTECDASEGEMDYEGAINDKLTELL